MRYWLQVVGVLLLTAARQATAVGEVGKGPNECYASKPAKLPITISYSTSSNSSATSFNFLVNVKDPAVTAFGIRLNDDLAVMTKRLSGVPAGQLVPEGPAFVWKISKLGFQVYTFVLNTTGLTEGTGPNAKPDLTDLCAQGIQIADDAGHLIWQQKQHGSSCVSWVKLGAECTFQTIQQHPGVSVSSKLNLPTPYSPPSPAVYGGPSSSPQSYGGNYMYLPASPPSPTPSPQLFGITTPAAYSPSPYSPVTVPTSPAPAPYYSPPAAYSQPASPPTLFGGPRVSPPAVQSSPYASPAYYSPKPYAYGAKPYSPAVSSPYYGLTARGTYAPAAYSPAARLLLDTGSAAALGSGQLFGARRLLATLPSVNKLVAPTCNLVGQQAEPACVQQGKCANCFEREITDIGLRADVSMVYDAAADQTTVTLALVTADTSMCTLDSVSLRVTQSALSSQLEPSAAVVSGVRMPEQQTTLHSSCDDSGLQSSVEWRQVTLVAGKATVEVMYDGKVEPFQEDVFVVSGSGQTKLVADAGTAVITVREADECYYHSVSVSLR
ncbi:hypothetical protein ABBQ38_014583 [Trebouxia sp. C0009 RCD-2024]